PAGSGLELEESGKSSSKKLDAMTLIKEDMSIFGHCPAHDDFYLVVCNHCSQVVKPQAFQKHCERRHGPLSKLYARTAAKCSVAVNGQPVASGTPGAAKALREKPPSARGRGQALPERPDKDNNLCIPKPDGHGIKVPPKAESKEPSGKSTVPAGLGGDSVLPADSPSCRPEATPTPLGEKDGGPAKPPPRSHKKLARKECDLNRQCGVLNPDTQKICTRLLTCKIHSVHQRREVRGRAKDFDVLVAELKASARKSDSPKERSPPIKDPPNPLLPLPSPLLPPPPPPPPPPQQDSSVLPQPLASPPSNSPYRAKPLQTHCLFPRTRLSSDSDPEDTPAPSGEGLPGVFPFPPPKGGNRVSSEESEEEGGEETSRPPMRPPRPQAFCTFGSRLVSPGCYVFNRRLDRFCSALGSMLERHLSSHMWRKIPPAADPPQQPPAVPHLSPVTQPCGPSTSIPSPPPRTSAAAASSSSSSSSALPPREGRVPTVGSPPAAAACSQLECGGGGSQSITSPLPANTPSPSFSKLPSTKASKSPRGAREAGGGPDPETRKRKPPEMSAAPPHKRTCTGDAIKPQPPSCQLSAPPGKTKPTLPPCPASSSATATVILNGATRVKRLGAPPDCRPPSGATAGDTRGSPLHGLGIPPRCISEDEVKKRKNSATYCRP
ncbi:AT7L2 protein, partial [Rhinopomastus cyanomelas]|nr:AT7L2 protein [Rhinopomastus cyanomelas]